MRAVVIKHGPTVAIIALVALNIVLIVPLVTRGNSEPVKSAALGPQVTASIAPSVTAEPPSAVPTQATARPRRLLAVNSDRVAWRAEGSECGQRSKIEVTTDGGKTWRATDSGLWSVVRLKAFGNSSVFAIGADAECNPVYADDSSPNAKWQPDSSLLSDTWYQVPNGLNIVHDPQDQSSQPCGNAGLVDLAGLGHAEAVVLCGDRTLRARDGSTGWHTVAQHSSALALNADDHRFVLVERKSQCAGLSAQRFTLQNDGLKTIKKPRCFNVSNPQLNDVAVSNKAGRIWVWSGSDMRKEP